MSTIVYFEKSTICNFSSFLFLVVLACVISASRLFPRRNHCESVYFYIIWNLVNCSTSDQNSMWKDKFEVQKRSDFACADNKLAKVCVETKVEGRTMWARLMFFMLAIVRARAANMQVSLLVCDSDELARATKTDERETNGSERLNLMWLTKSLSVLKPRRWLKIVDMIFWSLTMPAHATILPYFCLGLLGKHAFINNPLGLFSVQHYFYSHSASLYETSFSTILYQHIFCFCYIIFIFCLFIFFRNVISQNNNKQYL